VVLCEDFNGDGIDDLYASAVRAGGAGRGLIFFGRQGPLPSIPDLELEPPEVGAYQYFSRSAAAGDFDDDGQLDLAIGGEGLYQNGSDNYYQTGGVLVYRGGTDWSNGPTYQLYPSEGDDDTDFGFGLTAVDTGQTRFLAISSRELNGPDDFLYLAPVGPGLTDPSQWTVLDPPQAYTTSQFGFALAWVDDYFGQDAGAVIAGMPSARLNGSLTSGIIASYPLSLAGTPDPAGPSVFANPTISSDFGYRLANLGDVTDDGMNDLAIVKGLPNADLVILH
jgi:hypothetical protein